LWAGSPFSWLRAVNVADRVWIAVDIGFADAHVGDVARWQEVHVVAFPGDRSASVRWSPHEVATDFKDDGTPEDGAQFLAAGEGECDGVALIWVDLVFMCVVYFHVLTIPRKL